MITAMIFYLFLLFPLFAFSSIQETAVLYKGRYRPLEGQARNWMEEISGTSSKTSINILLNIYDHGYESYKNAPFFQILDKNLITALNLPTNKKRYSYEEIIEKMNSPNFVLKDDSHEALLELKHKLELFKNPKILAIPDPNHEGNWKELKETTLQELPSLYVPFAAKPYSVGSGQVKYYPSLLQLKVEVWLLTIPWLAIITALYCLSFIFWRFPLFLGISFLLHTTLLAARSYILWRPPVSNMAETLLWVSWIAAFYALVTRNTLSRRVGIFTTTVLASILLFSSFHLDLETIQPVLDSKFWLLIHVLMVVGSYAFFLIGGLCAHGALVLKKDLSSAIRKTLYLGLALLIPGTLLGGVWAAQSWGRFWDWDPKESWAFISAAVFLVVVHLDRFKKIGPFGLYIGAIIGFQTITFTWYGVNYILGTGLHSYGFGRGGQSVYFTFLAAEVVFLIFYLIKNRLTSKTQKLYKP
jgi:ABC-type transport system involved in cytochrome c biogenesis permease subunit